MPEAGLARRAPRPPRLPIDEETFLRVKGTGPTRWERFGAKVREICTLARAAGHAPQPLPQRRTAKRRR